MLLVFCLITGSLKHAFECQTKKNVFTILFYNKTYFNFRLLVIAHDIPDILSNFFATSDRPISFNFSSNFLMGIVGCLL